MMWLWIWLGLGFAQSLPPGVSVLGEGEHGGRAELAPIAENSDWVALGESIHRSDGFARVRRNLTMQLVREHGYRLVAIESPYSRARIIDRWLQTCEGDPMVAMEQGLFGIWQGAETYRLMLDLCIWNQEHPSDKVRFVGFDLDIDSGSLALLAEHSVPGTETWTTPPVCAAREPELLMQWEADHGRMRQTSRRFEVGLALQSLRTSALMRCEEKRGRTEKAHGYRDDDMAQRLVVLRQHLAPGAKTVIWAHNRHIQRANDKVKPVGGFALTPRWMRFKNLGMHLDEQFGDRYASVGLVAHQVYSWVPRIPESKRPDSVESDLLRLGHPALWVDPDAGWSKVRGYRVLGEPMWSGFWDKQLMSEAYDALVFLNHAEPTAPTPLVKLLEQGDASPEQLRIAVPELVWDAMLDNFSWVLQARGWRVVDGGGWTRDGTLVTWNKEPSSDGFVQVQFVVAHAVE